MDNLLKKYILTPKDPYLNFELAKEYLKYKHYAAASTYFLRAAEWGDLERDKYLIYESLMQMSLCLKVLGNRQFSEEGWLLHAISVAPERPEALWLLSNLYKEQGKHQESKMISSLELNNLKNRQSLLIDIGYSKKYDVDVVIVSWAKTEELKQVTKKAIDSLRSSERSIFFHVYIVESNKDVNYNEYNKYSDIEVKTIYTNEPFGYNKYLNIGIKHGDSPYVVSSNSDVIFHENWASNIIKEIENSDLEILSVSPWDIVSRGSNQYANAIIYPENKVNGACIFQQRKIFDIIEKFDEELEFHYCDTIYEIQLVINNIIHYTASNSIIEHNAGATAYKVLNQQQFNNITSIGQGLKFMDRFKTIVSEKTNNGKLKEFDKVIEKYEYMLDPSNGVGSDIKGLLPILRRYAKECDHITELGVRDIVSTWAILAGRPKTLISIDLEDPLYSTSSISEVYDITKSLGINYKFIKADDLTITLEETDLLFIDTYHVYSQLKKELELHGNKARKYIIMHDTTSFGEVGEDGGKGLNLAIKEYLESNNNWKIKEIFTHSNGLTILERK